jgi:hypothetical protein
MPRNFDQEEEDKAWNFARLWFRIQKFIAPDEHKIVRETEAACCIGLRQTSRGRNSSHNNGAKHFATIYGINLKVLLRIYKNNEQAWLHDPEFAPLLIAHRKKCMRDYASFFRRMNICPNCGRNCICGNMKEGIEKAFFRDTGAKYSWDW